MDNNLLRKIIKEKIEKISGWKASYTVAVDVEEIPYITFEMAELLLEDDGKHIMEITINAWGKDTPYGVIEAVDKLDAVFKKYKELKECFLIQIFCGSERGFVEDEDKTIKRLQRKYDLIVYERGV